MNVAYINPFISSTINVVRTMAFLQVTTGAPFINRGDASAGAVTGVIGLAGSNVFGSVIISFKTEAILEIVNSMLGEQFDTLSPDVEDAVGELTNMIVGGAKRILTEKGFKFNLALPTIVKGENVTLNLKTKGPRIVLPFTLASGASFSVEASIEEY